MKNTLSVLAAAAAIALAGCGKAAPPSGTGAYKLRDQVWATYGWSKGRMAYVIYVVPPPGNIDAEGMAGTAKITKEADFFEGGLDGKKQMTKMPFKVDPKKGEIMVEGKTYRGANVLLVNPTAKEKVQMIQGVAFGPAPKDPDEWPIHAENEIKRIAKENPKIAEFPNEPAPAKPDVKKKK